jgi:23S rRNA pseudouridine1911/1915/1917 synthase
MSRNVAQQWLESGAVSVDGQVVRRPAVRVREGAVVRVVLPATALWRSVPQPEDTDVRVLYEDRSFIAIDKPPGIVVHPSYKQLSGTLLNALLWRLRDRADARPGILTRLDKDSSGIVIVALDATVHAAMQRAAAGGELRKEYLAVVTAAPRPREGRIDAPLGRDPHDRRRVVVTPGGAASQTRYEVLAQRDGLSLVRCELVTGRTHQIRVHLASRGWPILGDRVYGTPDDRIARQALHAWRVTLRHPVSDEPMRIAAPVPVDMKELGFDFAAAADARLDTPS